MDTGFAFRRLVRGTPISDSFEDHRHRRPAVQLADLLCGVRRRMARAPRQLGLVRQSSRTSSRPSAWARTTSWPASTTSRNGGKNDNWQSGSQYNISATSTILDGASIYPVFRNDNTTFINWLPIFAQRRQRHQDVFRATPTTRGGTPTTSCSMLACAST